VFAGEKAMERKERVPKEVDWLQPSSLDRKKKNVGDDALLFCTAVSSFSEDFDATFFNA